jgi:hypothetical protein
VIRELLGERDRVRFDDVGFGWLEGEALMVVPVQWTTMYTVDLWQRAAPLPSFKNWGGQALATWLGYLAWLPGLATWLPGYYLTDNSSSPNASLAPLRQHSCILYPVTYLPQFHG